jgi:hypothetical protein
VKVTCKVLGTDDAAGVSGARVTFQWRLPNGTRTIVRTTNNRGRAVATLVPGEGAAGRRVVVYVRVSYEGERRSRGIAFVPR